MFLDQELESETKKYLEDGKIIHMYFLERDKFNETYEFFDYKIPSSAQAKEYIEDLGFKCFHENKDFFTYEPEHYDVVIDNTPYSIKKEIIEQLIKNGKPFALYLPLETLERKYIKQLDTSLLQVIIPSDRTNFITNYDITKAKPPHTAGKKPSISACHNTTTMTQATTTGTRPISIL
jgi:hypothetical protein